MGERIPASWTGDDIIPACQVEWRLYAAAPSLPRAKSANGPDVQF